MSLTRRAVFEGIGQVAAMSVAAAAAPAIVEKPSANVSQDELTASIISHSAWLRNPQEGARANFSYRDLSGLDFNVGSTALVDLSDADLTGADLTGVKGANVSFLRASLHDARLSWSLFEQVSFNHACLRRSKCDNVTWGWAASSNRKPGRADPHESSGFQYMDASYADFYRATVRGLFHEAKFVAAQMSEADFSYSEFCGTGFSITSFHAADLAAARFRFANLSYVNFSSAKCTETDFTGADVGYRTRFSEA
ncbi:pentapeptide repeat-containing protein [Bradyrhizobium sp. GCM10028915]|uniref:pentapeptide repeat-containing protein n=1 Tax=Bradyrhizobium sp. GCM10028915 TaxID=3273385 RepID=UPI00361A1746